MHGLHPGKRPPHAGHPRGCSWTDCARGDSPAPVLGSSGAAPHMHPPRACQTMFHDRIHLYPHHHPHPPPASAYRPRSAGEHASLQQRLSASPPHQTTTLAETHGNHPVTMIPPAGYCTRCHPRPHPAGTLRSRRVPLPKWLRCAAFRSLAGGPAECMNGGIHFMTVSSYTCLLLQAFRMGCLTILSPVSTVRSRGHLHFGSLACRLRRVERPRTIEERR